MCAKESVETLVLEGPAGLQVKVVWGEQAPRICSATMILAAMECAVKQLARTDREGSLVLRDPQTEPRRSASDNEEHMPELSGR
jgi:hypothetical protein